MENVQNHVGEEIDHGRDAVPLSDVEALQEKKVRRRVTFAHPLGHTRSSCMPAVRAMPRLILSMRATEYRRPRRGSIRQSIIRLSQ